MILLLSKIGLLIVLVISSVIIWVSGEALWMKVERWMAKKP